MPIASFATRAYDRAAPGLPEQRAVNVFVAPTPAGPTKFTMHQRWGLSSVATDGTGPIRGVFQQAGLFSGDRFCVSGGEFYRAGASLGAVGTTGNAQIAGSDNQIAVVDGGYLYIYDGSSFFKIDDFKDAVNPLPAFIGVIFIAQRFILLCADGTFYWSDVDDGHYIDVLNFATAESSPDGAVGIAKLGDEFAIFGNSSVEWWFITGASDAPYQRSANRTYSRGCGSQGSVVQADNTLVFVGDDRIVYRAGLTPTAISNHGVEQRLTDCSSLSACTAFTVTFAGHPFYVLNISGQTTVAFDFSTKEWAEWTSYGKTLFRCASGLMYAGAAVLGDDTTGGIWTLSGSVNKDGSDQMARIASAMIPQPVGFGTVKNLTVIGARGNGSGNVSVRVSDDGVNNWSSWSAKALSGLVAASMKLRWMTGFGPLRSPGKFIEVEITDDVNVSLSGLIYNEPRP